MYIRKYCFFVNSNTISSPVPALWVLFDERVQNLQPDLHFACRLCTIYNLGSKFSTSDFQYILYGFHQKIQMED
jgi:hypothetical protein